MRSRLITLALLAATLVTTGGGTAAGQYVDTCTYPDTQPPDFTHFEAGPNVRTADPALAGVEISAKVEDGLTCASGIVGAVLYVDDDPYGLSMHPEDGEWGWPDEEEIVYYLFPVLSLSPGVHRVRIVAYDGSGNPTDHPIDENIYVFSPFLVLTCDNAPPGLC